MSHIVSIVLRRWRRNQIFVRRAFTIWPDSSTRRLMNTSANAVNLANTSGFTFVRIVLLAPRARPTTRTCRSSADARATKGRRCSPPQATNRALRTRKTRRPRLRQDCFLTQQMRDKQQAASDCGRRDRAYGSHRQARRARLREYLTKYFTSISV